jgi:hypothetical protein
VRTLPKARRLCKKSFCHSESRFSRDESRRDPFGRLSFFHQILHPADAGFRMTGRPIGLSHKCHPFGTVLPDNPRVGQDSVLSRLDGKGFPPEKTGGDILSYQRCGYAKKTARVWRAILKIRTGRRLARFGILVTELLPVRFLSMQYAIDHYLLIPIIDF